MQNTINNMDWHPLLRPVILCQQPHGSKLMPKLQPSRLCSRQQLGRKRRRTRREWRTVRILTRTTSIHCCKTFPPGQRHSQVKQTPLSVPITQLMFHPLGINAAPSSSSCPFCTCTPHWSPKRSLWGTVNTGSMETTSKKWTGWWVSIDEDGVSGNGRALACLGAAEKCLLPWTEFKSGRRCSRISEYSPKKAVTMTNMEFSVWKTETKLVKLLKDTVLPRYL